MKKICEREGCDRPSRSRGLCAKHYHAFRAAKARFKVVEGDLPADRAPVGDLPSGVSPEYALVWHEKERELSPKLSERTEFEVIVDTTFRYRALRKTGDPDDAARADRLGVSLFRMSKELKRGRKASKVEKKVVEFPGVDLLDD